MTKSSIPPLRVVVVSYVGAFAVLFLVVGVHLSTGLPIRMFVQDTASVARTNAFTGFVSNLGVLLWTAAGSACLLTGLAANDTVGAPSRRFFLFAGALSTILALDDVFQLHETVLPRIGIPELVVLALYAVACVSWIIGFRREIATTEYALLATAVGFFGVSTIADLFHPPRDRWFDLYEEGLKWLGIVSWTLYFGRAAYIRLRVSSDRVRP